MLQFKKECVISSMDFMMLLGRIIAHRLSDKLPAILR